MGTRPPAVFGRRAALPVACQEHGAGIVRLKAGQVSPRTRGGSLERLTAKYVNVWDLLSGSLRLAAQAVRITAAATAPLGPLKGARWNLPRRP